MKAEWIWASQEQISDKDVYAGFKSSFNLEHSKKTTLNVSCDSAFVAYVNGKIVGFSGCADYPHHKLYDEIDITEFCEKSNELYILVWYFGADSQTYIVSNPGLWFEVKSGNSIVCASGSDTVGRFEKNFKQGYSKTITAQLGYSFYFDNTIRCDDEYIPCVKISKMMPQKRNQKNLCLDGRIPATYIDKGDRLLVDLGRESAGYPDLDFESPCDQELVISYGEHLEAGEVLRLVGGRDFSFEFKAKKGRNTWFIPLRRLGCRYLEVHYKEKITPTYIGMQHVYYPMTEIKRSFDDELLQKIYDVSVRTLRLCMHEHYEDTPWREQALYALDSRNQILFGYSAFEETDYARSNLSLINKGLRPDGLLSICFPAGKDHPIPFFSLAFILETCEYVEHTGDITLLSETKETIATIIDTFNSKIDGTGLIPSFPYPFWNFYEWSEGNAGRLSRTASDPYIKDYDLILNAFYCYVINLYNRIAGTDHPIDGVRTAIKEKLFDKTRGLYKISLNGELFGQLGNALAILAGLGDEILAKKVALCDEITPATLSMKPFVYDALLSFGDEYKDFVLKDIRHVYEEMLKSGATSFWETELGWKDFALAGSLCHGWSASPAHYLVLLGCEKK